MTDVSRRVALAGGVAAAGGLAMPEAARAAAAWPGPDATPQDWPQPMGYADHRSWERGETSLTPSTVERMRLLWSTPVNWMGREPIAVGSSIYAHTPVLTRLDAATGTVVWQKNYAAGTTPAYAHGIVVTAQDDNRKIRAANAATGAQLWASWLPAGATCDPTIVGSEVYVSHENTLHVYDLMTGRHRWQWTDPRTGPDIGTRPNSTATVFGSRVFLTRACNALVAALDRTSHVPIWQRQISDRLYGARNFVTPVADEIGSLYVAGADAGPGVIRALDQGTGALRWAAETPAQVSQIALSGETLVVNGETGLAGFDRRTGRRLWFRAVPIGNGLVTGGGVAYAQDSQRGELVACEVATGRRLTRVRGIYGQPLALARGRLILRTSESGHDCLAAFGLGA